jgi:hypothetical protein
MVSRVAGKSPTIARGLTVKVGEVARAAESFLAVARCDLIAKTGDRLERLHEIPFDIAPEFREL